MFFSFLVPIYNTEKYLSQCIDSLLDQCGASFEIILLDDGSTDNSPQICDKYAAAYPNIKVVHKENEGLLLTRRRGFREASGDWFICVDSDDYVAPDLLKTVVAAIENHSGCDMVMYNYQYVDDRGTLTPSRLHIQDETVFRGEAKRYLYAKRLTGTLINNMWMRAVHRSIVDIDADYSRSGIRNMCEDALQVLPLYTNTACTVYADKPLYFYRKSGGSITSRVTVAHWQAIHRSFALEQPYAERWDVPEAVKCERYTKQMENICNSVRWLYNQMPENADLKTVRKIKEDALFDRCREGYDTKYASSKYSAVSMPIIAAMLKQERFRLLAAYFKLERTLRRRA